MSSPQVGDPAPDFSAIAVGGPYGTGTPLQLSSLSNRPVVLYFYPKDDTPGCTAQACDLNTHLADLRAVGIEVLGVSADGAASHTKFIAKYGLGFDLLADTEKTVHQAFGVWGPKKFMGRSYDGTHRTTFLIDGEGIVQHVITKPNTKAHAAEILAAVAAV